LGLQSKNAVRLWPRTLGGLPADYIVTDDASDAERAVANGRKLVDADNVDALVASNISPIALDVLPIAAQSRTPLISLAASSTIVQPMDAERRWVFKMPQNDSLMAAAIVDDMVRRGYGRVAFIAYADAYGDSWQRAFTEAAAGKLEIAVQERYKRTDKSVAGQALRIIGSRPDAVLVAASGTGAALPQLALHERGYTGQMYQTHGVGTSAFLSVGGTAVEGTRFPTGPALLARQLPASNPVRQAAVAFTDKYEAQYGPNTVTQFSADAYGAWMLLDAAAARALKAGARPGTPEFRAALRSALEATRELSVPNGVMNMSESEHQGFDGRARVMGVVKGGKFTYAGE
jgi:branched-chain amino acid transport system substrate-binding protein